MRFGILQKSTTTPNFVAKKREDEVEPTYHTIICVSIFRLLSERIVGLGPTDHCCFSRGSHFGGHKGEPLVVIKGAIRGGHKGGRFCLYPCF